MSNTDMDEAIVPLVIDDLLSNPTTTYGSYVRINTAGTYDVDRGSATDLRSSGSLDAHPVSNTTISTYTIYQNERTVSPSYLKRPVTYELVGNEHRIREMTDTEIENDIAGYVVSLMSTGMQGGYFLGLTSSGPPAGGTWTSRGTMTDTYWSGASLISESYTLWQKTAGDYSTGSLGTKRPLKMQPATSSLFNPSTAINGATEYISISGHSFVNGDIVQYTVQPGNTSVSGLTSGNRYYIVSANSTAFQLSLTDSGSPINISAGLNETGHIISSETKLVEMTNAEVVNLSQAVGEYIRKTGIGKYAFQTTAPATGTWISRGSFVDKTNNLTNVEYGGVVYNGIFFFSRLYSGAYTGDFTGGYSGFYDGVYSGTYQRSFSDSFTLDGTYTGTYSGVYISYSGNFSLKYSQLWSGSYDSGNVNNFTQLFSTFYQPPWSGGYTKTFSGIYSRDYTLTYTQSFQGSYTPAPSDYSRLYSGIYIAYSGNFSQKYSQLWSGDYNSLYSREFSRIFNNFYSPNFGGNYTRTFDGTYNSLYSREFSRIFNNTWSPTYSGLNYSLSFTRLFSRDFSRAYSRNFNTNYFTGTFSGGLFTPNYSRGFSPTYSTTLFFTGLVSYAPTYSPTWSIAYSPNYTGYYEGSYTVGGAYTSPPQSFVFFDYYSGTRTFSSSTFTQTYSITYNKSYRGFFVSYYSTSWSTNYGGDGFYTRKYRKNTDTGVYVNGSGSAYVGYFTILYSTAYMSAGVPTTFWTNEFSRPWSGSYKNSYTNTFSRLFSQTGIYYAPGTFVNVAWSQAFTRQFNIISPDSYTTRYVRVWTSGNVYSRITYTLQPGQFVGLYYTSAITPINYQGISFAGYSTTWTKQFANFTGHNPNTGYVVWTATNYSPPDDGFTVVYTRLYTPTLNYSKAYLRYYSREIVTPGGENPPSYLIVNYSRSYTQLYSAPMYTGPLRWTREQGIDYTNYFSRAYTAFSYSRAYTSAFTRAFSGAWTGSSSFTRGYNATTPITKQYTIGPYTTINYTMLGNFFDSYSPGGTFYTGTPTYVLFGPPAPANYTSPGPSYTLSYSTSYQGSTLFYSGSVYTGTYTLNATFSPTYSSSAYSLTVTKSYTSPYFSSAPLNFTRYFNAVPTVNYSPTYTGGTFTQDVNKNYTSGPVNFTRGFSGSYSLNTIYSPQWSGFVFYTQDVNKTFTSGPVNFTRAYAGSYSGEYTSFYVGNYSTQYTQAWVGFFDRATYTTTWSRNYVGDYNEMYNGFTRTYGGTFLGANYTQEFSRLYSRLFSGNYSGEYTSFYIGYYSRNWTKTVTRFYTTGFGGTFSGNYQAYTGAGPVSGTFTGGRGYSTLITRTYAGYSSSFQNLAVWTGFASWTGNVTFYTGYSRVFQQQFSGDYQRNYSGAYSGLTTLNTTSSITYTLWVRTA